MYKKCKLKHYLGIAILLSCLLYVLINSSIFKIIENNENYSQSKPQEYKPHQSRENILLREREKESLKQELDIRNNADILVQDAKINRDLLELNAVKLGNDNIVGFAVASLLHSDIFKDGSDKYIDSIYKHAAAN